MGHVPGRSAALIMNSYKIEPFAAGYLEADSEYIGYKIASGMRERARNTELGINRDRIFAGEFNDLQRYAFCFEFGTGIRANRELLEEKIKKYPQYSEELRYMWDKMSSLDFYDNLFPNALSELQKNQIKYKVCHGGDWIGHANPVYFLENGTVGLREKIEKYRKINLGKDDFYDAAVISLEALEILGERYRDYAFETAKNHSGERAERLNRIGKAFENIPKNKPRNLFEACQLFWLIFTFDGYDSPGRLDQTLIEYYRKADETERTECLKGLWELFHDNRVWNLTIGGSDEAWQDKTTELSYDILKTARKFGYQTPNLTMRVHKNTPERLLREAAETIATGIGMPVLYNDECVCPALAALGIPPEDSHGYCMNGCNQIDVYGKSHMGLEDGEVCLAKCLQLALNNGLCSISGKKLGAETGNPTDFKTFEEFLSAYKKQVEFATDSAVEMANISQKLVSQFALNPHRSNLIEGCIEKGLDLKNHGPLYGHGQILAEGIADAVDSIAAVKHLVYDTKKYSMQELLEALECDFEGFPELYHDFSGFEKFGNNSLGIDEIYKDITEHFYKYLLTKETFRGGIYGGGCSPFNRAADFGIMVGALPNGKKKASPLLADSIGAVPGCDRKGITALLNSVMSVDQTLAKSGHILNLKFKKEDFSSKEYKKLFLALVKTYFEKGGQQLSVTVVSAEDLIKARENPELYKNLIVRVGGYSDYFTNLTPELQENVIHRTLLEL